MSSPRPLVPFRIGHLTCDLLDKHFRMITNKYPFGEGSRAEYNKAKAKADAARAKAKKKPKQGQAPTSAPARPFQHPPRSSADAAAAAPQAAAALEDAAALEEQVHHPRDDEADVTEWPLPKAVLEDWLLLVHEGEIISIKYRHVSYASATAQ